MPQLPKLMSMKDVMRELRVSRQRIYAFIEQGKLNPQDTAAGKIFSESEVLAFKKEREKRLKERTKRLEKR